MNFLANPVINYVVRPLSQHECALTKRGNLESYAHCKNIMWTWRQRWGDMSVHQRCPRWPANPQLTPAEGTNPASTFFLDCQPPEWETMHYCGLRICLVTQSHPTLCNPMDCSLPGSSVHAIFFSRQEYWSGLPFLPPGDFLDPGIEPMSPVSCIAGGSTILNKKIFLKKLS